MYIHSIPISGVFICTLLSAKWVVPHPTQPLFAIVLSLPVRGNGCLNWTGGTSKMHPHTCSFSHLDTHMSARLNSFDPLLAVGPMQKAKGKRKRGLSTQLNLIRHQKRKKSESLLGLVWSGLVLLKTTPRVMFELEIQSSCHYFTHSLSLTRDQRAIIELRTLPHHETFQNPRNNPRRMFLNGTFVLV